MNEFSFSFQDFHEFSMKNTFLLNFPPNRLISPENPFSIPLNSQDRFFKRPRKISIVLKKFTVIAISKPKKQKKTMFAQFFALLLISYLLPHALRIKRTPRLNSAPMKDFTRSSWPNRRFIRSQKKIIMRR